MLYRNKIHLILLFVFAAFIIQLSAQQPVQQPLPISCLDSINRRIQYLEQQVTRLKQIRDVAYLNMQRELDHTLFLKSFEEFILEEDLDKAKQLVELKIEKAEFRRDQSSVKFYYACQEKIYSLIKQQRIHYQELFLKEKNFKKEYAQYIAPGTMASYQKTQRMVTLALKFATENNLAEIIKSLELYDSYTRALMFDLESTYDLAELTNNAKSFEKVFLPLVSSDSLPKIKEAEKLLAHCKNFGKLTGSALNGEYFKQKDMLLTSALSDIFDRQGREQELARYTDQSVVAQIDTINPCGVFKWHDQIIVIDEFQPASSMENVKKGEAIIHADRMLAAYLEKNKLCQSIKDLKMGYAFIIPFQSNAKNSSFFYNRFSQKWQYIACYTVVLNDSYTAQVSKLMPPLFFEDEMDMAVK